MRIGISQQPAARTAEASNSRPTPPTVRGKPRVPTLAIIVVTAALIGCNYVALKAATPYATPLALTGLRAAIGGTALLLFARARGERMPRDPRSLLGIFLVSLLVSTGSSGLLVLGVRRVASGLAALASATMPLFAAIFAVAFLKERLRRTMVLGTAVGLSGALVLASPALSGRSSLVGIVLLLAATSTWGAGVVLQKGWQREGEPAVSAVMFVALQLLMSAVTLLAISTPVEGWGGIQVGWKLAVPLVFSAIPSMAIPFAMLNTVLRRAPAIQAAAMGYLIPVFGVLASWLVRGEVLASAEWAGGALIMVGVVLVNLPAGFRVRRNSLRE